ACDGDQPGVQMNLYRFVKGLGLTPLLCGNIKGLQDHYRNPTTQEGYATKWGLSPQMATSFADGTKISFEQAIVANGTGMRVAQRGMLGYEVSSHVDELTDRYDIEQLRALGGIVDYVVGAAQIELKAGQVLDGIGFYMTYGQCENAQLAQAEQLLPMGVAEGCRLKRDIGRDQVISYQDVDLPIGRLTDRLRAEQAVRFGRLGAAGGA